MFQTSIPANSPYMLQLPQVINLSRNHSEQPLENVILDCLISCLETVYLVGEGLFFFGSLISQEAVRAVMANRRLIFQPNEMSSLMVERKMCASKWG
jgi:hypothetical protein